jgi:glutathione S-transferase
VQLIGQYDSPFVRRVGITLSCYDLAFDHLPWSTFSDAEKLRRYNPLLRVPILVLDDGDVLTDSHLILDYLDSLVPDDRLLTPRFGPARRRNLIIVALATGLGDKAVSLFYEQRLHTQMSDIWINRCTMQIEDTLSALERDRAGRAGPYWFGATMSQADITVACILRHLREAHPQLGYIQNYAALSAHCEMMEAMTLFKEIQQPFIPPA